MLTRRIAGLALCLCLLAIFLWNINATAAAEEAAAGASSEESPQLEPYLSKFAYTMSTADGGPDCSEWLKRLLVYSPSGDALYDAYQQALLAELARPLREVGLVQKAPLLSEATLASLEAQFGSDPRFWQLRLHELRRAGLSEEQYAPEVVQKLEQQWNAHAKVDPVLGQEHFVEVWFDSKELPYYEELKEKEAALTALTGQFPDESLFHYQLAMLHFERGDWDAALPELDKGNGAANNRDLALFPVSFLKQRLRDGLEIGNEAVAGITLENAYSMNWGTITFIRLSDLRKEFEVRGSLGADYREAASLHLFLCRLAQMEGAGMTNAMTCSTVGRGLTEYLLTNFAESFSVEQREALLRLYNNWDRVFRVYRDTKAEKPSENQFFEQALTAEGFKLTDLSRYIKRGGSADLYREEMELEAAFAAEEGRAPEPEAVLEERLQTRNNYMLEPCLRALWFQYLLADQRFELYEQGRALQKSFERGAGFDWQTLSFPPAAQ